MLVLTRKAGEKIRIGHDVTIEVYHIGQHAVKLAFTAPQGTKILRSELENREKKESK